MEKIKEIQVKHAALERQLQSAEIMSDPQKLKKISREYNELGEVLALNEKSDEILAAVGKIS